MIHWSPESGPHGASLTPGGHGSPPTAQEPPSTPQSGLVQVWLPGLSGGSHGGFSTLNTSDWPNDASVCSLSSVLQDHSEIPPRFYLSHKACTGILRRADNRGKGLPTMLLEALRQVVGESSGGGDSRGQDPVVAVPLGVPEVAHTLRGEGFDASEDGTGRGTPLVPVAFGGGNRSGPVPVAATLTAKGNRQDFEVETFIAQPQPVAFSSKDYGGDAQTDLSPTLRAGGHDGSHANAGVPPAIAFAMRGREEGNVPEVHEDGSTVGALRAADGGSTQPHVAVAFAENQRGELRTSDVASAQGRGGGKPGQGFPAALVGDAVQYAVRRLTPDECARLQGFPDGHSRIPWRGRPAEECPDGPQYKTYGNSMARNVIIWLAQRIEVDAARVDAIKAPEAI